MSSPIAFSVRLQPGDCHDSVKLLGSLRLSAVKVDGQSLGGLSGLAWDNDAGLLYALADDARVFHLRPVFSDDHLISVQAVAAYRLRDRKNSPLVSPWDDAEGLAIANGDNGVADDTRLAVSFERKPRVIWYSATGQHLTEQPLPSALSNITRYAEPNKALEALALHPQWGLLTAPEWAMRGSAARQIPIVALGSQPRLWSYPLAEAPNSALVGMDVFPDGDLLTLERAFVSPLAPLIITLRRTQLQPIDSLTVTDVAVFDNSKGWILDNFEGLAHHREQRFFIVSDDNRRASQQTLLVYFAVLGSPRMTRPSP
ncbi:MAG: esterase-like activity of phytase family protein [Candidatus Competibacteraceae bacterium]|nr:esterase-like activity of phytase family protein [Candidatus Competibacteraceae bacterium]